MCREIYIYFFLILWSRVAAAVVAAAAVVVAAAAVVAAVGAVTVAVEGGCDFCLLYRIYYIIVVNILFYCNGYIILLC